MGFIIQLNQNKINSRQQELGWDIFQLVDMVGLTEIEGHALLIKNDKEWKFKPFGKDHSLTMQELTPIIKGVEKIANTLNFDYKELIKMRSV